jgi:hypothetical protein
MKILFFVDEGFSRGCLQYMSKKKNELSLNFMSYIIRRGGVEMVVIVVRDEAARGHLMRMLNNCGVDFVYEMEGVPKVLRYVDTRSGTSVVEAGLE